MSTHPVRSWGEPIQAAPTGARGEPPQRPLDRIVARRARWIGGLVIAWALSRVGYFAAGVRFDGRMLDGADQIVDRELLRTDYWRTLWYLHSQPPLFNAFVGAVEHLPKAARPAAYWLSSCSATVATGIGAAYLARSARISPKAAWVIAVLLVVRPDAVLYEQWFFYTNFEAALLVVALAGMRGWASSSDKVARLRWAIPASGGLTALVLMRSLFHVLFVVFVVGVVTLAGKLTIRQCIQIALLPVVLGTLLYVKNYVYFDSFGPSTWQGENLARITLGRLSSAERDQLITEGVVSVNAAIIPFTPNYAPPPGTKPQDLGPETDAEILNSRIKSSIGTPNFNWRGYLPLFRAHLRDSVAFIRQEPSRWFTEMGLSWKRFFNSPGDNIRLEPNSGRIDSFRRAVDMGSGQIHAGGSELTLAAYDDAVSSIEWGWVIAWILAVFGPVGLTSYRWWRGRWGRGIAVSHAGASGVDEMAHFAIWAAIVYVSIVGNSFEQGENNRFRFVIDSLILIGAVATATNLSAVVRVRRTRAGLSDAQ